MRRFVRLSRHLLWFVALLLAGSVVPVVAGPVFHEMMPLDLQEDMHMGARTPSGALPAVLSTRGGLVAAPAEGQTPSNSLEVAYGGRHTATSPDSSYHVDGLTTRPESVRYDEPFRPSILPFKRLYAFDHLESDLSFSVRDKALIAVSVGGDAPPSEDAFYGDLAVDLVKNVAVRIPSVGPGAKLRALHVDPPRVVEVLRDSADNWFLRAQEGGRVRVVLQLSINRSSFGSLFRPVSWDKLAPFVSPLPSVAHAPALEVAKHIGVSRRQSPAQTLDSLVRYFRNFHESAQLPDAKDAQGLYRELSMSQKGVCRHRAYSFTITALSLGLPTRLVHNEAHAWVEVYDSEVWHRIDLGGAATTIQRSMNDALVSQYRPPKDPHSWPVGSHSGGSLSRQARENRVVLSQNDSDGTSDTKPLNQSPRGASSALSMAAGTEPEPEIRFQIEESRILRGHPLKIFGSVRKNGKACPFSRIDIYVQGELGGTLIGSVASNSKGIFEGQVTLPSSTPVGHFSVRAEVAGGCK